MLFQRLKTPGLAHHSYIVGCGEAAVVVDPRRDIAEYLRLAREAGLAVSHVLLTHRQEDFEHGSAALAAATGARVVAGRHANFGRVAVALGDGEALEVGDTRFVALETPGHTPESVCYAAYRKDAGERCWALFSGDTLFVGATGRTDLADPARTAENAAALYDAVHRKLAPLGPQALLYAAHGSGSACGGAIADRDDSTLGTEMQANPVFTLSREAFVGHKLEEKLPRPPYFRHMERVNVEGGRAMSGARPRVLPPREFQAAMAGAVVIDTRMPDAFAAAHVPGTYNVWLQGLATFGGWLAREADRVLLVTATPQDADLARLSLARVGIDRVEALLGGGIAAWREAGLPLARFGTEDARAAARLREEGAAILDVRDDHEWSAGHIPGARHVYVGELEKRVGELPRERALVVHCSVGNRSGLAASILHRHGFSEVKNLLGGFKAWKAVGLPTEGG